jgi:hypothetical protein
MVTLRAVARTAYAVLRFDVVAFGALVVVVIDLAGRLQLRVKGCNFGHCPNSYWHWFQDLWLLPSKGTPTEMTTESLYEEMEKIPVLKNASILVLAFDRPPDYYGKAKPGAWRWLEQHGKRAT